MTNQAVAMDTVVLRRPHFHLLDSSLYFLISKRPYADLTASEVQVWNALREETPLAELLEHFPGAAADAINRFVACGICELTCAHFPTGRRRVLVIEPHSDDAVLSVGGAMWLRRDDCEFTVATVGSRSNFTSYYYSPGRPYLDVEEVSALRRAEGQLAMRRVGGQYRVLGLSEAALRYKDANWSAEWFREHGLAARVGTSRSYSSDELRDWTSAIELLISESACEEIWAPLGVGPHCDHQLTRDAFLNLMRSNASLFAHRTICLYQEVPYAARYPGYTETLVRELAQAGASLVPVRISIQDAMEEKMRSVSIYGSQFKISAMRADVEECAQLAAEAGCPAEVLWRLERAPAKTEPATLHVHAAKIKSAVPAVTKWVQRHRSAKRIRLLLLLPLGRGGRDIADLRQLFPGTAYQVYAAPSAAAEMRALEAPDVHVHQTGAGPAAWGRLALKLMCSRPCPTLLIAGEKRQSAARKLALLWPLSDTLILSSMDQFLLALPSRLA